MTQVWLGLWNDVQCWEDRCVKIDLPIMYVTFVKYIEKKKQGIDNLNLEIKK